MDDDSLFRGVRILAIGTAIVTILNFGFQLTMGNFLEEKEFSNLIALLALLSIFSLPLGVFESGTSATISKFMSQSSIDYWRNVSHFSPNLLEFIVLFMVAFFSSLIIIPISDFVNRMVTAGLFGVIVISLLMFRVRLGIFQGKKAYLEFSLSGIINSSVKLVSGVILLSFGMDLESGIVAILIGFLSGLLFLDIRRKKVDGEQIDGSYLHESFNDNKMSIAFALILVGIMMNWDVIVANYVLESDEAGQYALSAVLAKVVVLASTAVIGVMVPSISEVSSKEERFKILGKLVVPYFGFVIIVLFFANTFEHQIINGVFFNSDVNIQDGLLVKITFCYSLVSIAQMAVFSSIARLDHNGKTMKLAILSAIPIFSFTLVSSIQSMFFVLISYSSISVILLVSDEFFRIKRAGFPTN